MFFQTTIERPVSFEGIGLHTGMDIKVNLIPAQGNTGLVFRRIDLPGKPEFRGDIDAVSDTTRCTRIGQGEVIINTVEHFLACVNVLGIDNMIIEVHGPEMPSMDGSAIEFWHILTQAGKITLAESKKVYELRKPVWVREQDKCLVAMPHDEFKITYTIVFAHKVIGTQFGDFLINEQTFAKEIAPARTWGFMEEVEQLIARGLAKGGSVDNAIVVTKDGTLNPLRYSDEFVRHKVMDLVGDLAFLGSIKAHIIAIKSSHALNHKLAQEMKRYLV